jgi:hypothetical protein
MHVYLPGCKQAACGIRNSLSKKRVMVPQPV